jgi:membrane protein
VRPQPPRALRADQKFPERAFRIGRRFVRGLMDHDAFGAAASIAFWIFLSFVPLLVLLGFLVGQVARVRGVDALIGPILEIVPGTAEGLVGKELQRLAGANASVAPVGVAGFLWTASSGLHNLMDVFETAMKVTRRPWWKQRVIALGWVLLGLATACALAWILVRTDALLNAYDPPASATTTASAAPSLSPSPPPLPPAPRAAPHAPSSRAAAAEIARARSSFRRRVNKALNTPVERLIAGALMLVTGAAFLAGFYRYAVEHPAGVRRRVWPGAVAAIVSWLIVSSAFGNYAVSIADYALYYGSLAAVAVLLIWLYLTSLTLVVGAEVNAQLEGLRDEP